MAKPFFILLGLLLFSYPALAAPKLTDADEQRLADGTTDNDDLLDQQNGFYVLLRSAGRWRGDDFAGDAGAKVAPPADFDYIRKHPAEVRGNVYLIEGWLAQHDRYPNAEAGLGRDKLYNLIDPSWGERVTRWTIVTEEDDPSATVIVIFNDPNAKMPKPGENAEVKVAARFYKLWTIKDATGKPFTYPVFVGGAAEVVEESGGVGSGSSASSTWQAALFGVITVVVAFYIFRFLMNKMNSGKGQRTAALIAARRRDRDEQGEVLAEDIDDLPDDPIAALDALSKKHGMNDQ
ncbi:MAG: hypothetical protein ACE37H_08160 [Phycisphaeraceae bacterium]